MFENPSFSPSRVPSSAWSLGYFATRFGGEGGETVER